MQVSKNTVSKNTAADFHRRRLLILCASRLLPIYRLRIRARSSHPSAVETGPSKLENPMNYVFTVFTRHDLAVNEQQPETMHKRPW